MSETPFSATQGNFFNTLCLPAIADTTYTWYPSDTEKNYEQFPNQIYTRDSFDYTFNSLGYRSEEIVSHLPNIVYIGCSLTMGVGLPLEDSWAWRFHKAMEEKVKHRINYLNFSHGGKSVDYCSRVAAMLTRHCQPTSVIFNLPHGSRQEIIVKSQMHDVLIGIGNPVIAEREMETYTKTLGDKQCVYNVLRSLIEIDAHLKDVPWLWSCWGMSKADEFKDFQSLGGQHFMSNRYSAFKDGGCDLARDNRHPGKESNKRMAELLFDEISERVAADIRNDPRVRK